MAQVTRKRSSVRTSFPQSAGTATTRSSATVRQKQPKPKPAAQAKVATRPAVVGVYVISVAARLLEMHPQTLRKYERAGLVNPSRTDGLLRLYSEQDIARLKMVKHLVDHWGMNLAGVEMAINLFDEMLTMQQRLLPMLETNDDMLAVFRQAWGEMLKALQLPGGATAAGVTIMVVEEGQQDEPTERKRTRKR